MRRPRSIEIPHNAWRSSLPVVASHMAEAFGAHAVKVHSEYHLRVTVDGRTHDVWVTVQGVVKYKLSGTGRTIFARSHHAMADALKAARNHKTELEKANKALELARLVRQAQRELPPRLQEAVFCDAGYQPGKAMAAAVYVCRMNGDVEAIAKSMPLMGIKSVEDAEYEALIVGAWLVRQFAESARCIIYTDSKHAAHRAQREAGVGEQVQWLSREKNKAADKLANLRGKK